MAAPYKIQRSMLPIPHAHSRVAVTWNNATIVWDPIRFYLIHYHISGEWLQKETTGYAPWCVSALNNITAEVVDDKIFVVGTPSATVLSLDLNTWVWEECKPEGQAPPRSFGKKSWVHKQKIYFFGGGYNAGSSQLFCYDYSNNCWEWPTQAGDIPPPKFHHSTMISGDTVFLFGGGKNDLHMLNMEDMRWKKVHDEMPTGSRLVPYRRGKHTLTRISKSSAVLYGSYRDDGRYYDDSWLLNINSAKQLKDPSFIWSKIPNHHLRLRHAAVLEPVSKSLWVIGGVDGNSGAYTSDLLKMSFNLLPLKDLAIDHVARRIDPKDQWLLPNELPRSIKKEIEDYRAKIGDVNICSAEAGCQVCQQNRTEN